MKCEKCGKGIGVVRRGQMLSDGFICYSCLDELGFDKKKYKRGVKAWPLAYWEIKDGPDRIHYNQAARKGKHEDWMEKHSDLAAVFDTLEEESTEAVEMDENNEE